jgi:hypothetical protein
MKYFTATLGFLTALALFTSCGDANNTGNNGTNNGGASIELGQAFVLPIGQSRQTADKTFTVQFDKVVSDSRCPAGAQCIWAGKVEAAFTLTTPDTTVAVTLTSNDDGKGNTSHVTLGRHLLIFTQANPPKPASEVIKPEDYKAVLVVKEVKE